MAINVTPVNVPPNADAGADVLVQLGEVATLDGSASSDPDTFANATLTFQWSFVSVAAGSTLTNANITNATTPTPSFTPDVAGGYLLRLDVSDGVDTASDQVMVTATELVCYLHFQRTKYFRDSGVRSASISNWSSIFYVEIQFGLRASQW